MKKRKVKRYDEGGFLDTVKEGFSKVFRRDDDSSKFSDLESVGGAGNRPKTIEEQIKGRPGRENEGKEYAPYRREPAKDESRSSLPAPKEKSGTFEGIERDVMKVEEPAKESKPAKEAKPAKSIKSEATTSSRAAPTNAAAKQYDPSSKPIKEAPASPPAKMADKKVEPKPLPGKPESKKPFGGEPLPGKPEAKSKVTPYSAPKKISKEEEAEGERGKRMEAEAAAQQEKNKKESEGKTRAGTAARTPETKTGVGRTRAGTIVKSTNEPTPEAKAKALSSWEAKLKKQYKENKFDLTPSKNPNRGYKAGGSVSSASKRADGIAMRGKTKGRIY